MKYTNLRAFEKHLEAATPNHFSALYLVLAKESFERKQAVDKLLAILTKELNLSSLSQKQFDGETIVVEELAQELNTLSFFSPKRLILITQVEKLKDPLKELLQNYFVQPNRAISLILSATALAGNTRFYQRIEKAGVVLELSQSEKAWEKEKMMLEWLGNQAKAAGKLMDAAACHQLVQQLGTDQPYLYQELEKLVCYVGERPHITKADIAVISNRSPTETIWQLGEALFQRDTPVALRIVKDMLTEAAPLFSLLRQIRSQFQTEYQVCSILTNGGGPNEVSAAFPYMKGAILERHMQMAKKYGMDAFKKALIEIDSTEVRAKNSAVDHDILAERLVIKLTEGTK